MDLIDEEYITGRKVGKYGSEIAHALYGGVKGVDLIYEQDIAGGEVGENGREVAYALDSGA